jgi:RimJ/RimL family protein N-acetyltransferase
MVTKSDLVFRRVVTLRDGARVLLRPLLEEDRQAMLDLFLPVSYEERRFMRDDVNDPEVINSWIQDLDYDRVFPLVAVMGERIAGVTTLHFNQGSARHRCELRIFLSKEFRRRGLGNKLLQAAVEYASKRSLGMVEVQVVSEHADIIKALQRAGFEIVCTFEDYFILPDGDLRDIVLLVLRLRRSVDEF